MSKYGLTEFSCKKAFELSYALFRIAAIAKSRSFAGILEEKATLLLNSVLSEDYENARAVLKHIEYFMRLGADVGLLHFQNAGLIIKEGNELFAAIAGLPEPAKLQELNLDKVFSKPVLQDKTIVSIPANIPAKRAKIPAKQSNIPAKVDSTLQSNSGQASSPQEELQDKEEIAGIELQESDDINPAKSALRQSAIMSRLRQSGNCRITELQKLLPEISERTLRYDLQSLIDRGLVERIGGSRNSFYRFKAQAAPIIELPGVSSVAQ